MWKQLFQGHILGRRIDYYNHNLVADLYVNDNIIEATVYGNERIVSTYLEIAELQAMRHIPMTMEDWEKR